MKTKMNFVAAFMMISLLMISSTVMYGQSEKRMISKYLDKVPPSKVGNGIQKYRMTAVYINRDLYGNFIDKTKVSGDYTTGLENGYVLWENVLISASKNYSAPFPEGEKQQYMEGMKYIPSSKMLDPAAFINFPSGPASEMTRNLVWDTMALEEFAFNYSDSLKLNRQYTIPGAEGAFSMAGTGTYNHAEIRLCRSGISSIDGEIYTVIEFNAPDNNVEISMPGLKTNGTEQYWGTVWVSLQTGFISNAVMLGGTVQEVVIDGMKDKFIVRTVRDLKVEKIR